MEIQTDQKLDVVHVAETIRGGIATYLREIIPLQVARYGRGRVAIIAPGDQIADLGRLRGVVVFPFVPGTSRLMSAWRCRRSLGQLESESSIGVVHLHSTFAGLICRIRPFGWRRTYRVVYCAHGWAFTREGRSALFARILERRLAHHCDSIVCISHAEKDAAIKAGLPRGKLSVIHNGLADRSVQSDIDVDGLWGAETLRLVFLGRLDRQKGFDVFLDALSQINRSVEVQVFGASVLGDASLAAVPTFVRLNGWSRFDEVEPYLRTCDAVVMPSRWEGFGLTALEAMRAGKPVIASQVGGLAEIVSHRINGVIVPPADARALCEALETVCRTELVAMGARARQHFLENFLVDKTEEKLDLLYRA